MNCQNCHQPLDPGAAFCGNCGQPVTGAASQASPAPTQASPAASPIAQAVQAQSQTPSQTPGQLVPAGAGGVPSYA